MATNCKSCGVTLSPVEAPAGFCYQCERQLDVSSGGHQGPHDGPLPCPQCSESTDSLKYYSVPFVLFFWIAGTWSLRNEIGCPSCIRKSILLYGLINIVTANLLWPFIILPWTLINLARSFTSGHSSSVHELLH
ncbi:MAG: hypothetical protein FJ303_11415 [Planctomycetes bacterium]|nr:hypothetical protein [Planctomycetota bacterium]